MSDVSVDQISRMLVDAFGGRTPWVLLWVEDDGLLSNMPPEDVPELLCTHLLRILRHEMSSPEVIVSAH